MLKSDIDLPGPRSIPGPSLPCHQTERAEFNPGVVGLAGLTAFKIRMSLNTWLTVKGYNLRNPYAKQGPISHALFYQIGSIGFKITI